MIWIFISILRLILAFVSAFVLILIWILAGGNDINCWNMKVQAHCPSHWDGEENGITLLGQMIRADNSTHSAESLSKKIRPTPEQLDSGGLANRKNIYRKHMSEAWEACQHVGLTQRIQVMYYGMERQKQTGE